VVGQGRSASLDDGRNQSRRKGVMISWWGPRGKGLQEGHERGKIPPSGK